jgi:hypothetical protein
VAALLLYLDQNYLSGIVKRKPAFRELEPVLRAAVAGGTVATEIESSCTQRSRSAAREGLRFGSLATLLGRLPWNACLCLAFSGVAWQRLLCSLPFGAGARTAPPKADNDKLRDRLVVTCELRPRGNCRRGATSKAAIRHSARTSR